jgi:hypothetical protein
MRELKWQPGQSANLMVLSESNGGGPAATAQIREFFGKRLRLTTNAQVKGGAAVRLEWDGQLVLGEVLKIEPGGFWMEIRHVLPDTAGLAWQKAGWQRG